MKPIETELTNKSWPEQELEYIDECPMCQSVQNTLAFDNVQDWSFYASPGKWPYWNCKNCESLYLNPRPTKETIGRAYSTYYTHTSNNSSFKESIKTRLKNECYSHWFRVNISPRFNIPKPLKFLLAPLKIIISVPFELPMLVNLKKGTLLDIGCGSGSKLLLAKSLGWNVTGLELDNNAVKAAQSEGLNVIHGDYKTLEEMRTGYDCIICSHVIEHVYEPEKLLEMLLSLLNKSGTILLSAPNSKSHLRYDFGSNWRGLEAPRHICIPSAEHLISKLQNSGEFHVVQEPCFYNTLAESLRIKQRMKKQSIFNLIKLKWMLLINKNNSVKNSDYVQLIITRI